MSIILKMAVGGVIGALLAMSGIGVSEPAWWAIMVPAALAVSIIGEVK